MSKANKKSSEELQAEAKTLFEGVGYIYSPALEAKIHFTADGWHHLLHKKSRNPRPEDVWVKKLELLPRAIEIVEISTTYQEYETREQKVRVMEKKKRVMRTKPVKYWALVAIVDRRKVKVVIRRVGNGQYQFWSVIPNWKIEKVMGHKVGSTAVGNLEED